MQKKTEKRIHPKWTNTSTTLKHHTFTRSAKTLKRLLSNPTHNSNTNSKVEGTNTHYSEYEWKRAQATTRQSCSQNWMR